MKKIVLLFGCVLFISTIGNAQIIDPADKAKDKTTNKVNQKTDEAIDGSLNKIEDGIKDIFKKKEKKPKKDKSKSGHIGGTQSGGSGNTANTSQQGDNTNFDAYKNFDFVPGKDIIFFDDFSDRSTKRWDAYEPSHFGVVQIEGKPWLEVKGGRFYPVGLKVLPKDFTLEFDAYVLSNAPSGTLDISFVDKSQSDRLADPWYTNSGNIAVSPVSQMPKTGLGNYEKKINDAILSPQNEFKFYSWQPQRGNLHARVSIARKGNRLSLYINEEKVMDNIDFFDSNIDYMLTFHLGTYFIAETRMYFTNFRLASGIQNAQNEMAADGKFVTNAIYFDVASSKIKPESWSTLSQAAAVIKSTSGNILIVGHTDADGSAESNLALSQKRAASVKNALVSEFGIPANRLTTDGKGLAEPIDSNTTASGKAKNRRVEFIKQ